MAKGNKQQSSAKRVAIESANAQMVIIVAISAFIAVFCLMASKAVLSQNQYNSRVMSAKEQANNQLKKNIKSFDELNKSYKAFDSTSTNIIGGVSSGEGDNDGPNSKIILDALPSTYDFPALTASIEKIFRDRNINVSSITGTDDQVTQQTNASSANPKPVEVPFTFTITNANYKSAIQAIETMQRSIRPMQIDTLEIHGNDGSITITVTAHTYFQPSRSIQPTTKVVK